MYYKELLEKEVLKDVKKNLFILSQPKSIYEARVFEKGRLVIKTSKKKYYSSLCFSLFICEQKARIKFLSKHHLRMTSLLSKKTISYMNLFFLSRIEDRRIFYSKLVRGETFRKDMLLSYFSQDENFLESFMNSKQHGEIILY